MFNLLILTLEETVFSGKVRSIVIPGAEGYFEVLPHHAPLIALVKAGKVEVETSDSIKEVYAISGGFFEFENNKASLIADTCDKSSENL